MSHIPSKSDLARDKADAAAAKARAAVPVEVQSFTAQIVAAMNAGQNSLKVQLVMPSAEAERQLRTDFDAQGWTLSFHRARTGGSISWS